MQLNAEIWFWQSWKLFPTLILIHYSIMWFIFQAVVNTVGKGEKKFPTMFSESFFLPVVHILGLQCKETKRMYIRQDSQLSD